MAIIREVIINIKIRKKAAEDLRKIAADECYREAGPK
jgi:hypothetical protein